LISWGIRQISGFTIGDWKYSKVENPVWHKMALTWPVDGTGAMIPVSSPEKKISKRNQLSFSIRIYNGLSKDVLFQVYHLLNPSNQLKHQPLVCRN